jgi:hypothetical protein
VESYLPIRVQFFPSLFRFFPPEFPDSLDGGLLEWYKKNDVLTGGKSPSEYPVVRDRGGLFVALPREIQQRENDHEKNHSYLAKHCVPVPSDC